MSQDKPVKRGTTSEFPMHMDDTEPVSDKHTNEVCGKCHCPVHEVGGGWVHDSAHDFTRCKEQGLPARLRGYKRTEAERKQRARQYWLLSTDGVWTIEQVAAFAALEVARAVAEEQGVFNLVEASYQDALKCQSNLRNGMPSEADKWQPIIDNLSNLRRDAAEIHERTRKGDK